MTKDFDTWNLKKKSLEIKDDIPFYATREIWFCSLGVNLGFEQDGKNDEFERPVLVLKKFNKNVFWGVPLSTKIKPKNRHYLTLKQGTFEYSAIISQLRLYDSKRLQRKLYMMDKKSYDALVNALARELPIKKSDPTVAGSSEPEGHCDSIVTDINANVNIAKEE